MNEKLIQNMEKFGYEVHHFATASDASSYLNSVIDGTSVGIGGSETVVQMGLLESLASHNTLLTHQVIPEGKTAFDMRMAARDAKVYISSVNAIAETGEIVNIDGTCNRVAEISFGHEIVYLLVGKNKITADLESAIFRARNVASPLNAKRLHRNTPCAEKADKCYDCNSPERICRELTVLLRKPGGAHYVIVLIDEEVGY